MAATHTSLDVLKLVRKYREGRKAQKALVHWTKGHQAMASDRVAINDFLLRFYRPESASEIRSIGYEISSGTERFLPLVTKDQYLLRNNAQFSPGAEYAGILEKDLERLITDKELAEQIALWELADMRLWDAPIFSLRDTNGCHMKFVLSRFFSYRPTFGSLADELAIKISELGGIHKVEASDLPRRQELLGTLEAVTDCRRIVAGGPVFLFAVQREEDIAIIIQRRSLRVSDDLGAVTTNMAFHQPVVDPKAEIDVKTTILRECYEELLGGQDKNLYLDPKFYLQKCPAVGELDDPRQACIQPTGFVWELTRGNFTSLYCCYVHNPEWWRKHGASVQFNWEVDAQLTPLVSLKDHREVHALINHKDWAPDAYAAFVEGLRWLATYAGLRELNDILPRIRLGQM